MKKKIDPPMRRCVGCMQSKPKQELLKIVSFEGEVALDLSGRANGRGVYLCKDRACIDMAEKKRAIGRSLKTEMSKQRTEELFAELRELVGEADEK